MTAAFARAWPGHLARGMGLACLLLALLTAVFSRSGYTFCQRSLVMVPGTILLALITVVIGFAARQKMALRLAGVSLLLAVLTVYSYSLPPCGERIDANDVSAVGSLRSILTAQADFARSDPENSYAATLQQLGPGGANLIDEVLARGEKKGFRFTLVPGPRDAAGRITSFTLRARPLEMGRTGFRNFLTGPSGVIYRTTEDRPATPADYPIN